MVRAKNLVKVGWISEVWNRPPILRSFASSSAIKIMLTKDVVVIMQIISLTRDNFKYGQH